MRGSRAYATLPRDVLTPDSAELFSIYSGVSNKGVAVIYPKTRRVVILSIKTGSMYAVALFDRWCPAVSIKSFPVLLSICSGYFRIWFHAQPIS